MPTAPGDPRAAGPRPLRAAGLALAALAWTAAAGMAAAQEAGGQEAELPEGFSVESSLDRSSAGVGEPVVLSVTVTHPPDVEWEARSAGDRLGSFEIAPLSGPETALGDGGTATTHWTFGLTAFELGELDVPALELRYTRGEGAEVRSIRTQPARVTIEARVTDPNAEAADIRWGFKLPSPGWLVPILAGALLLAGLAALAWWWRRRRRRAPAAAPQARAAPGPPPRPAYERYLEALEALLARGLVEKGRIKEFHIGLSEIVKRYLGEVFAFDAVDRTTEEVMEDLERRARPTLRGEAGAFLESCDMVKFAEVRPGAGECSVTAARARKILEMGRPVAAPPPGSHAGRPVTSA